MLEMTLMTTPQGQPTGADTTEPHPGSVVLTNGEHGTAWQRHFSDGLWHRTGGGKGRSWAWLLNQRNLVVVYDAPVRRRG